jgi:hypothetical protein
MLNEGKVRVVCVRKTQFTVLVVPINAIRGVGVRWGSGIPEITSPPPMLGSPHQQALAKRRNTRILGWLIKVAFKLQ